jgi:hypothetical protein
MKSQRLKWRLKTTKGVVLVQSSGAFDTVEEVHSHINLVKGAFNASHVIDRT